MGLLGAVTLSACVTRPPVMPVVSATPAPAAPTVPEAHIYLPEARSLATYPDRARRDKGRLIVSYDGKDVAAFTDVNAGGCEGYDTCSVWTFLGLMTIGGETFVTVSREQGEGASFVTVDREGRLDWIGEAPVVSADGHYIANGADGTGYSGYVSIIDWRTPRPRQQYVSQAACQPQGWDKANTLKLSCSADGAKLDTAIARKSGDHWDITPGAYAPVKAAPAATPKDISDLEAWQGQQGYQRLVP